MRRITLVLITLLLTAAGCGSQTVKQEIVPEFVLTYAENHPEDYPTTLGGYQFAELVQERTGGRIQIIIRAGGALGDEQAVLKQLQFGGIDFTRASLSSVAAFVPRLNVLQMPYLYTGPGHMWDVLEGDIGDTFKNSLAGSDMVALSWYDAGARNFYNSKKPVHTLEDMKGMRIRVQESEVMADIVEALGAIAVPMVYGEVYSGLETGMIDGAENNWPSYESSNHYEVARYYTLDEHTRVPELQLCAQSTWDKMSPEDQKILRECAEESALYERMMWIEREKISEKKIRESGCEIIELSPEEKEKFQAAIAPVYEKICGSDMDIVDAIIAAGR